MSEHRTSDTGLPAGDPRRDSVPVRERRSRNAVVLAAIIAIAVLAIIVGTILSYF